jgi:hypothetical protein
LTYQFHDLAPEAANGKCLAFCIGAEKFRLELAGNIPGHLGASPQIMVTDAGLAIKCFELCHLSFPSLRVPGDGLPGPGSGVNMMLRSIPPGHNNSVKSRPPCRYKNMINHIEALNNGRLHR